MTRSRALGGIADGSTALYYLQRAGAGLIISEGSPIAVLPAALEMGVDHIDIGAATA